MTLPTPAEIADAKEHFYVDWEQWMWVGYREEVEELFANAFALLQANQDVIEWLMCMFQELPFGPPDHWTLWSCIRMFLNEGDPGSPGPDGLVFRAMPGVEPNLGTVMRGPEYYNEDNPSGDRPEVQFWPTSNWDEDYGRAWREAIASGSEEEMFCVAMFQALTLLHELIHVCGLPHSTSQQHKQWCDYVNVVPNSWMYIMMSRYPGLALTKCANFGRPETWANSGSGCHPSFGPQVFVVRECTQTHPNPWYEPRVEAVLRP